jgi:propionyl-CoA carboxylase alpha chain
MKTGKFNFEQKDLKINGHAVEVRVYAEDPTNNFLPDIGNLQTYKRPQGPGIRVDDGFEEGMDIPIYYDHMIAKLITYADNRELSLDKMIRAIEEYEITGVQTTLSFCKYVMKHESFRSGRFDTHFVKHYFKPEYINEYSKSEEETASLLSAFIYEKKDKLSNKILNNPAAVSTKTRWKANR